MREPDRIIRLKTVLARTGLSRSTIYRKIAEGTFPAQLKISVNGTGWHESDINRWIADPVAWRPKREFDEVREVGGCLERPAASLAADSSEPDRPQAVKAGAVAPPLRGFGLDGLTPPRFGLSKQTKADCGRTRSQSGPLCLHQPCAWQRLRQRPLRGPQGSGKPRADRAARAHDDAGDRRRGHARLYAGNQSAQPPAPKLIGIHPPELAEAAKAIAEIVRVIEQAVGIAPCPTG